MMDILANAQKKHSLYFLNQERFKDNDDIKDPNLNKEICNGCLEPISKIIQGDEWEFLIKCQKKTGKGGCSWVSCHHCIKEWFKITVKKYKEKSYNKYVQEGLFACPQCKVQKTYDVDYNELMPPAPKPIPYKQPSKNLKITSYKTIYKPKSQDDKYIFNPKSGKHVLKTGIIGCKILKAKEKKEEGGNIIVKGNKILNPDTGIWVLKTGITGKKILKNYEDKKIAEVMKPFTTKKKVKKVTNKITKPKNKSKYNISADIDSSNIITGSRTRMTKQQKNVLKEARVKRMVNDCKIKKKKTKNIIDDLFD